MCFLYSSSKNKIAVKKKLQYLGGVEKLRTRCLLSLKDDEAELFMNAILLKQKCIDFINHDHLYNYSNLDDIRKMTSDYI